jgi:exonuclease SbcD
MRFLHTSDWHVGKSLRGRSRIGEHEDVLAEIAAVADRERVDLALVVGDLFDSAAPAPEAERVVYRALLDLAAGGTRPVVVVAGNHDSATRLAALAPLLRLGGVHVRAGLAGPDDGGVLDVPAGGHVARIALVPFPSQRYIVDADALMSLDADQHKGQYAERVRQVIARLAARFSADTVNLVVAHLMVGGGVAGGGERSAHTLFDYWVPATSFPADAHYVALGHLHRPQRIDGPCPVWYSGSPLQLDFGEDRDDKAVVVVDAVPGAPASIRQIGLTAGRRLQTLRGSLAELAPLAGTTGDDHLRVIVREPMRVGLADEVRSLFPDAVDVVVERPDDVARGAPAAPRAGRPPRELFESYLAERGASDERLVRLFTELLEEASATSTA